MSEINYMESDDMPSSTLELEWDMETELEEVGNESFEASGFTNHNVNTITDLPRVTSPNHVSTSPKGRFQRLEEEPEYFSHSLHSKPKSSQNYCTVLKTFFKYIFIFILGILVGYFSRRTISSSHSSVFNELTTASEIHIINEIVNNISKENIETHYRYFIDSPVNTIDLDPVNKIALLWKSEGLEDAQLVNYSVLLDLPGSAPNTITLKNGQCYYPNGQDCDEETKSQELLYTYAAYSASGTLEGQVIDVQYGTVEDLQGVMKANHNFGTSIALLKLGVLPLSYKLSLLEDLGFGGVLLYLDPCDVSEKDQSFMVSLKYGIDPFMYDSSNRDEAFGRTRQNVTSLLVQPVTFSLLRRLYSFKDDTTTQKCVHVKVPPTERVILTLHVQSSQAYKDVSNVIGFLRGSLLPDRYIIIGSPISYMLEKNIQAWASGAAIMTSLISAIISNMKTGWRPQRTLIFCLWGGGPFSNFGSYKWGKEFHTALASNAVAYISLQHPIRGNGSLRSISSPSLQQLATEVMKKVHFICSEKDTCQKPNVSSLYMEGDADFFINQLGIPASQFIFEDIPLQDPHLLSEAFLFANEDLPRQVDPSFLLHEHIAKVTAQMVLQIATEPVLPFSALDIALEIQKRIEADILSTDLVEKAKILRATAELFQSNEMRPANDPKERDPTRVRMLNDILQSMEKNFLVSFAPPGFPRNILYRLDGSSLQFSILQEAQDHCKITKSNETLPATLQEVLNCISSAQLYFRESLHVFESDLHGKD